MDTQEMMEVKAKYRELVHKLFTAKYTDTQVQLLRIVFDSANRAPLAEYCENRAPQIQYVTPLSVFLESFEQN